MELAYAPRVCFSAVVIGPRMAALCGGQSWSLRIHILCFTVTDQSITSGKGAGEVWKRGKRPAPARPPPIHSIGSIETARYRFLRSEAGGSVSLARLVEMITVTDGPRENLLSWRISGSLQQIFGLEVL